MRKTELTGPIFFSFLNFVVKTIERKDQPFFVKHKEPSFAFPTSTRHHFLNICLDCEVPPPQSQPSLPPSPFPAGEGEPTPPPGPLPKPRPRMMTPTSTLRKLLCDSFSPSMFPLFGNILRGPVIVIKGQCGHSLSTAPPPAQSWGCCWGLSGLRVYLYHTGFSQIGPAGGFF